MKIPGCEILVRTLIEQGVDVMFGYPGGQVLNIYDKLYDHQKEIRHVITAHEQAAAHAADGYARATGKVGVCIATSGPGATNLTTGLATAYLDSVPVVAITGNVAMSQIGRDSFQEVDITGITMPITKYNYFVSDVTKLADTIREAFRIAKSGRPGPVLIDIPTSTQKAVCDYEPQKPVEKDPPLLPDPVDIAIAAKMINEAENPVIYIGGGVITSDASKEVLELSELIDAPISSSLMGLSAISSDNPRFLGMQGMHGHFASSMAVANADLIIALGSRFSDRATGAKEKYSVKAKKIHIDVDDAEIDKNISVDCGIQADIKESLKVLLTMAEKKSHPDWQAKIEYYKDEEKKLSDNMPGLTPYNVINVVNEVKSDDTPVATDVGQHQMWAAQYLDLKKQRTFLTSGGLGTMGYGMGASIGASIATGLRTILITGDGSFGMNLNEIQTAVYHHIPLTVLIMNNGVLGMVRQWQTLFYNKHYSSTVLDRATDYVKLADAFGAKGHKCTSIEDLKNVLEEAQKSDDVWIIDCPIDKDEFVLPMLPPGGSMDDIITRKDGLI